MVVNNNAREKNQENRDYLMFIIHKFTEDMNDNNNIFNQNKRKFYYFVLKIKEIY